MSRKIEKQEEMNMKTLKRSLSALLALMVLTTSLSACGSKEPDPVNTASCTYDEMTAYLTAKGYIAEGVAPVDINTTEGYVTDNTGGEMPFANVADKAEDFGGLWLFWWDAAGSSELYQSNFQNIAMNQGTIVIMGGACVLETAAYSGNFAIAFAEDYAQKDAVLADFKALPKE